MKHFTKPIFSAAFFLLLCLKPYLAQVTLTYTFTGAAQSFTVPSCVTQLSLTAKGARGGSNIQGVLGGLGGTAFGVLTVTPGDILTIYVGGSSGYNGGALAGASACTAAIGGVGGGSSDVRLNGNLLVNRVIVGGGGGGAGGTRIVSCGRGTGGGGGGGYYGGGGGAGFPGGSGFLLPTGGSQIAGGIGGTSVYAVGNNGLAGLLWIGGAGGAEISSNQAATTIAFTGGVGGGLTGGPGQYAWVAGGGQEVGSNYCGSSGGGGSSYVGSLLNASTISGNHNSDGEVLISYNNGFGAMPLNLMQATICSGGSVALSAQSQVSYTWSTGSNASNIIVSPTVNTSYSVSGTNSLGCISVGVITVSVDGNLPNVTINSSTNSVCQGNPVTLSGNGASSYTWSGGVPNGSPFVPLTTLTYSLTGANSCGMATALVTVSVNPIPTLSVSPGSVTLCLGNSTTLTASGANSYAWTGGIFNGVSFTPASNNIYSVTGTNTYGCIGTSTTAVTVLPTVTINSSTNSVCQGNPVTLSVNGANSYTWSGGVANGSPFIPAATLTYTLTGTNSCGTATLLVTVTVNPIPTLSVSPSSVSLCAGNATTLTASGANSYAWTGGISNGLAFTPPSTNIYTVTGTSPFGCIGTSTTAVTVSPNPSLTPVLSPSLICVGETCTISAAGASNYTWMPGGSNASSISVSPTITSVYSLTQSIGNCVDTKTVLVFVKSIPSVTAIASPSIICSLGSATLSGAGALSYTWLPFGGAGATAVVYPIASTIFTLSASDGTCVNSTTVSLATKPNPVLSIAASQSAVCLGDPVTLTASGASVYTWMPSASNGSSIVVNPATATSYSVMGTNSLGCSSMVSQVILVNPLPVISVSVSSQLICKGSASTLSALGADTYNWTNGPPNPITVVNPSSTSIFSVTGTFTNTGCASTQTVSVAVFDPQFTITGNPAVCIGGSTTLTATGANTYTWNGNYFFPSISVSPTLYTVYQVSASSASNNVTCASTQTIGVAVNPNPTVTATASKTLICKGESLSLSASGAVTYTWSTFPPGASVTLTPSGQQNYTVTGTDANGCRNTASVNVKVSACVGMQEMVASRLELLIYPNPSQGEFEIAYPSDINLSLVNALGQLIRHIQLSDLNNHKEHISITAPGVYFIVYNGNKQLFTQKILVGN